MIVALAGIAAIGVSAISTPMAGAEPGSSVRDPLGGIVSSTPGFGPTVRPEVRTGSVAEANRIAVRTGNT